MESRSGLMEQDMKDYGNWTKPMAKGSLYTQMETSMRGSGSTIRLKELGDMNAEKGVTTKELGKKTNPMALASRSGGTETFIKETSRMA